MITGTEKERRAIEAAEKAEQLRLAYEHANSLLEEERTNPEHQDRVQELEKLISLSDKVVKAAEAYENAQREAKDLYLEASSEADENLLEHHEEKCKNSSGWTIEFDVELNGLEPEDQAKIIELKKQVAELEGQKKQLSDIYNMQFELLGDDTSGIIKSHNDAKKNKQDLESELKKLKNPQSQADVIKEQQVVSEMAGMVQRALFQRRTSISDSNSVSTSITHDTNVDEIARFEPRKKEAPKVGKLKANPDFEARFAAVRGVDVEKPTVVKQSHEGQQQTTTSSSTAETSTLHEEGQQSTPKPPPNPPPLPGENQVTPKPPEPPPLPEQKQVTSKPPEPPPLPEQKQVTPETLDPTPLPGETQKTPPTELPTAQIESESLQQVPPNVTPPEPLTAGNSNQGTAITSAESLPVGQTSEQSGGQPPDAETTITPPPSIEPSQARASSGKEGATDGPPPLPPRESVDPTTFPPPSVLPQDVTTQLSQEMPPPPLQASQFAQFQTMEERKHFVKTLLSFNETNQQNVLSAQSDESLKALANSLYSLAGKRQQNLTDENMPQMIALLETGNRIAQALSERQIDHPRANWFTEVLQDFRAPKEEVAQQTELDGEQLASEVGSLGQQVDEIGNIEDEQERKRQADALVKENRLLQAVKGSKPLAELASKSKEEIDLALKDKDQRKNYWDHLADALQYKPTDDPGENFAQIIAMLLAAFTAAVDYGHARRLERKEERKTETDPVLQGQEQGQETAEGPMAEQSQAMHKPPGELTTSPSQGETLEQGLPNVTTPASVIGASLNQGATRSEAEGVQHQDPSGQTSKQSGQEPPSYETTKRPPPTFEQSGALVSSRMQEEPTNGPLSMIQVEGSSQVVTQPQAQQANQGGGVSQLVGGLREQLGEALEVRKEAQQGTQSRATGPNGESSTPTVNLSTEGGSFEIESISKQQPKPSAPPLSVASSSSSSSSAEAVLELSQGSTTLSHQARQLNERLNQGEPSDTMDVDALLQVEGGEPNTLLFTTSSGPEVEPKNHARHYSATDQRRQVQFNPDRPPGEYTANVRQIYDEIYGQNFYQGLSDTIQKTAQSVKVGTFDSKIKDTHFQRCREIAIQLEFARQGAIAELQELPPGSTPEQVMAQQAKIDVAEKLRDNYRSMAALSHNGIRQEASSFNRHANDIHKLMQDNNLEENDIQSVLMAFQETQKNELFHKRKFYQTRWGGSVGYDSSKENQTLDDKYSSHFYVGHKGNQVEPNFTFSRSTLLSNKGVSKVGGGFTNEKRKFLREIEASVLISINEHNKGSKDNPINIVYGTDSKGRTTAQPEMALALLMEFKKRAVLDDKTFHVKGKDGKLIEITPSRELSTDEQALFTGYAMERSYKDGYHKGKAYGGEITLGTESREAIKAGDTAKVTDMLKSHVGKVVDEAIKNEQGKLDHTAEKLQQQQANKKMRM